MGWWGTLECCPSWCTDSCSQCKPQPQGILLWAIPHQDSLMEQYRSKLDYLVKEEECDLLSIKEGALERVCAYLASPDIAGRQQEQDIAVKLLPSPLQHSQGVGTVWARCLISRERGELQLHYCTQHRGARSQAAWLWTLTAGHHRCAWDPLPLGGSFWCNEPASGPESICTSPAALGISKSIIKIHVSWVQSGASINKSEPARGASAHESE